MKGKDKIKLLKDILEDKDLVSKKILKEEEPEGELVVSAEADSPEEAKEIILKKLEEVELPDEEEMEGIEEEMMPEMEEDEDEDMELSDEDIDEEDLEMMDMLPEKSRCEFKKRLLEKIKSM